MEFQLNYFKYLKMILWKSCTQYVNKSGKLSSGHSTEKDSLHSKPKEGQCQRMLELLHNLCSFHMLARLRSKVFQARLQQYVNQELPDVQPGFQRGRGTRDQTANICWIMEKAREFQKYIYVCFIDYTKAFGSVDHKELWKILKEMGIPDYPICLLRNLYASQEVTERDME